MTNREIADVLQEMSICYAMDGVRFKPAAYERAAEAVRGGQREAADLYAEGGRKALRSGFDGVGEGIAQHIEQLLKRGGFPEYRACRKKYPIDLLALTALDEVGPKRAKLLYEKLKVKTVADLERAILAGKVTKLAGFGAKSVAAVLAGIERAKGDAGRKPLAEVLPLAERIVADLRALPGVKHAEVAGSVRRRQATIGDLDFLVTTSDPERVMAMFVGFPEVAAVLEHGATKTAVRLTNGMNADVRVIPDDAFGAALQYFTGDKNHNVAVRKIAIAKGLKLNEYGLWRGRKRLAAGTEEEVYAALGMTVPQATTRFDSGEIEAARKAFKTSTRRKK